MSFVPGDWLCGRCSNHNFQWRVECKRCGAPRGSDSQFIGKHGTIEKPQPPLASQPPPEPSGQTAPPPIELPPSLEDVEDPDAPSAVDGLNPAREDVAGHQPHESIVADDRPQAGDDDGQQPPPPAVDAADNLAAPEDGDVPTVMIKRPIDQVDDDIIDQDDEPNLKRVKPDSG